MSKTGIFAVATAPKLEREGAPLTFPANADGTVPTMYIARSFAESAKYRKAYEKHVKDFRAQIDAGTIKPEDDMRIMANVFADVNMDTNTVRAWEHIRLPEGVAGIGKGDCEPDADNGAEFDIEFTRDNVFKMLDGISEVFRIATQFCNIADNYRAKALNDLAKN